jgi:hypothetical protein
MATQKEVPHAYLVETQIEEHIYFLKFVAAFLLHQVHVYIIVSVYHHYHNQHHHNHYYYFIAGGLVVVAVLMLYAWPLFVMSYSKITLIIIEVCSCLQTCTKE